MRLGLRVLARQSGRAGVLAALAAAAAIGVVIAIDLAL